MIKKAQDRNKVAAWQGFVGDDMDERGCHPNWKGHHMGLEHQTNTGAWTKFMGKIWVKILAHLIKISALSQRLQMTTKHKTHFNGKNWKITSNFKQFL